MILADEQMRKKDEKIVDNFRIDAQIKAFEDAGFVANGKFLGFEDTQKVIFERFVKRKKYAYSIDVADQMLYDWELNIRANHELEMSTEFPDSLSTEDYYGEFEPEETETEKANKKFAQIASIRSTKRNNEGQ